MRELTKGQLATMDADRAELIKRVDEPLDIGQLLIINGAHTAGFTAGLECQEAQTAALVEALRPFAACAEVWEGDDPSWILHRSRHNVPGEPNLHITVGDLLAARAALASVEPAPALFSIWQRFKDEVLGNGQWGLWACTYHVDMSEVDARAKLAEIEADELERRERCPGTMAIYEIRPATKGGK